MQSSPPLLSSAGAARAGRLRNARRWAGLAALLCAGGLAGCATSKATRARFLERVPPPQPLLNASAAFADGSLVAQAWLGPSVRLRKPGEHGEHDEEAGEPRDGHRARFRGEAAEGDSFSRYTDPFEEDSGNENKYSQAEIDEMYGRVNYQYVLPPRLALTLTFANRGRQRMTVSILDVNSAVGDFAPRPDHLTIAPGQEASLDPMLSNLVDNFDELELKVAVQIGELRETRVLMLRKAAAPRPVPPGS